MKRSSEVCKIVGITKKTLRGYDSMELLHPTEKTEAGYWLYDDAAIRKLIFIQMLVEVGCKRKEIKALLESPDYDLKKECDKLLLKLEEKKKRLEGLMVLVRSMKLAADLPLHVQQAFQKANVDEIYREKSYKQRFDESVVATENLPEDEKQDALVYASITYKLLAIGVLKSESIDSEEVKRCFASFAGAIWEMLVQDANSEEVQKMLDESTDKEFGDAVATVCRDMFADPELKEFVEQQCGLGSSDFVERVLNTYKIRKPIDVD